MARWAQLAFQGPLTVHEPHVTQVELCLHTNGAAKLGKLLFKLENAVAAIDHEELRVGLTPSIFAVSKPVETIVHFTVPGCLFLPINFLDVAEQVETKVDADRDFWALLANRIKLEHCLCHYYLVVSMRTTILNQLLVDLVGSSQVCVIHALVANVIPTVTVLILYVE